MPKTKISEFSATPGNNTDIDGINIAEGCAPSGINDAIRELMSQLKDFQAGTAGDSFNGPVGTTTAAAGAFTTLSASGAVTLSGGTANGVAYLNGSKVLTTGSALTFDGTSLGLGRSAAFLSGAGIEVYRNGVATLRLSNVVSGQENQVELSAETNGPFRFNSLNNKDFAWAFASSEQMRLTSTGLGIGTSSPAAALHVASGNMRLTNGSGLGTANALIREINAAAGASNQFVTSAIGFRTGTFTDEGIITFSTALNASTPTERMRLDQAGNLGLGVTPSAWRSGARAFQLGATGYSSLNEQANGSTSLNFNCFESAANTWTYFVTGVAPTRYTQLSGAHAWFTAPSGTAGNAISFTQAMTLDASGNLGVGTTNPGCRLDARGTSLISSFDNASGVYSRWKHNGTNVGIIGTANQVVSGGSTSGFAIGTELAGELVFATNNTERARIDSSGNLLVGTTTNTFAATNGFVVNGPSAGTYAAVCHANGTGSGASYLIFSYNGSLIGNITQNGTTAVSYNTSSDYRLKENIQPMTGALAKVQALKPCTYNWKADGSEGEGFIAHELAEVVPQCVTGEKDAVDAEGKPVYQGIDTSFLVATLAAAIQEQQAMIQQLQAEVAALKGN